MCLTFIVGQLKKNSAIHSTKITEEEIKTREIKKTGFSNSLVCSDGSNQINVQRGSKLYNILKDDTGVYVGYKCLDSDLSSYYLSKVTLGTWMTADRNVEEDRLGNIYVTGFHILWTREDARKYKKHSDSSDAIYKVEYSGVHGWGFDGNGAEVVLASKMKVVGKIR